MPGRKRDDPGQDRKGEPQMKTQFNASSKSQFRRLVGLTAMMLFFGSGAAKAQFWTAVPGFPGQGASTALLRTDGTVMIQAFAGTCPDGSPQPSGDWYLLLPDAAGNYTTGNWSGFPSFPGGYAPLYYASAVLPDGRVVVVGGEYDGGCLIVDSSTGYILPFSFPDSNFGRSQSWQKLKEPWPGGVPTGVGDGQSVVLPDGTWMVANGFNRQSAILDPKTLTWSYVSKGKIDVNGEEGWTLLPNGDVMTIDVNGSVYQRDRVEVYHYKSKDWTRIKNTAGPLTFNCQSVEIGPAVLMADGKVFAAGADGVTAIYDTTTGDWTLGPPFPPNSYGGGVDGIDDGPAALMPNGNVLMMTSAIYPCQQPGADFLAFDGTNLNPVPSPPNASNEISYNGRMLVLPSGQILFTDGTSDVEIYTPAGTFREEWRPVLSAVGIQSDNVLSAGQTYTAEGYLFNGLSQGAAYGDDAQSATNFPLIRLTNQATGLVMYAPTADFSSGVGSTSAPKVLLHTKFHIPSNMPLGLASVEVVVNGIPSKPVLFSIE
jgi:hypothetical protein